MLIHLSTLAGTPIISIDPEGGPIPHIESLNAVSGAGTIFRLSFPPADDWRDGDDRDGGSAPPAAPARPIQADLAGNAASGKGRIWRYGAMTAAFASMLVVGMVAATFLHSASGSGSGAGAVPGTFRADASALPLSATLPSPPSPLPYIVAPPSTPETSRQPPQSPPPAALPSASRPAPMPVNPAALFGLHS
jgi:hypothetical protein